MLSTPQVITTGPYQLQLTATVISTGGHGCIVEGTLNDADHTVVCVKLMPKTDPHAHAELRAMMKLQTVASHPNIIRVLPPAQAGDALALPMVRHTGDLFSLVEKVGRMAETSAAAAMAQLVSAMAHCHRNGVYHFDLKPENVLYTQQDNGAVTLAVTDFGGAVVSESCTVSSPGVTTPAYSAPECHTKGAAINAGAADVWSLGVTLYAILTASLPWTSASDADEGFAQWAYDGKLPLDVPLSDAATDLLESMLAPEPSRRPSMEAVASHPWMASGGAPAAPALLPTLSAAPKPRAAPKVCTTPTAGVPAAASSVLPARTAPRSRVRGGFRSDATRPH